MGDKEINYGPVSKMMQLGGMVRKTDGWKNILTGLGFAGKDKTTGGRVDWTPKYESELESLYSGDDMAAKHVDIVPEEGTREWIKLSGTDSSESSQELLNLIQQDMERLNMKSQFEKAWRWARLYGGAGIFIAVDDGVEDLKEPLNIDSIRSIKSLTVFHRFELDPLAFNVDIENEDYLLPSIYRLTVRAALSTTEAQQAQVGMTEIHASRIIRFEGVELPRRLASSVRWWGDSVLNRSHDVIRNFNLAHNSVASVAQDFRVGVLKIKHLADIVTADKLDVFKARIEAMNLSKSVLNSIVIDAEDEGFDNLTTNLRGLDLILDKIGDRMVAATGLPHTVLLGEGSTGTLSGTGESEDKNFKDHIKSQQEKVLQKPIDLVLELIMAQKQGPTNGKVNDDVSWEFVSLFQQTDKQKADTRKIQAEADSSYLDRGVLSPGEVALSRFGGDEYSLETTINVELREKMELEEPLDNPPEPPPQDPPPPDGEEEEEDAAPMGAESTNHLHRYVVEGNIFETGDEEGEGPKHVHDLGDGTKTGPVIQISATTHVHEMPSGIRTGADVEIPLPKLSVPKSRERAFKEVTAATGEAQGVEKSGAPAQSGEKQTQDEEATGETGFDPGLLQSVVIDKKVAPTREEALQLARFFGYTKGIGDIEEVELQWIFTERPLDTIIEGSVRTFKPPVVGVRLKLGQLK